ncbi:MAG: hypothetical protein Q9208_003320 [Pyrenodesmia sp. 3 TL-2023]
MVPTTFLSAAVAVASLFSTGNAQVTTDCNPLHVTCPNDKGLAASTYAIDFTTVKSWPPEWTLADYSNVTFGPQGAEFTFAKRYDAPTMWTNFKFFFGRAEFVVKAAKGVGVISSMVLLSADLDEVDWEFLGGVTSSVQTNYFGKGYTGTYNRSTTPAVASPQTTFYTYTLDWSPTELVWSIDGKVVRTLKAVDADGNGDQYPQTPMKVSLSLWDAGDPDAATKEWAGGVTPIPPPEPYTMYVKSVKVWNTNPAGQYQWTDKSGSYQSIKIIQEPLPDSSSSKPAKPAQTLSLGHTASASTAATTKASPSSSRAGPGSVASSKGQTSSSNNPSVGSAVTSSGSSTGSKVATSGSSGSSTIGASSNPTSSATNSSGSPSHPASDHASKSTIYQTKHVTITSCHSSVKDCPATTSPYVTTSIVPVVSTVIVSSSSCHGTSSSTTIGLDGKPTSCDCAHSVTSYLTVTASSWASAAVHSNGTLSHLVGLSKSSSFSAVAPTPVSSHSSPPPAISHGSSHIPSSAKPSSSSPVTSPGPSPSSGAVKDVNTSAVTISTTGSLTSTGMIINHQSDSSAVAGASSSCTDTYAAPGVPAFSGQTSVISSLASSYASIASFGTATTPDQSKAVPHSGAASHSPSPAVAIVSLSKASVAWSSGSTYSSAPVASLSSSSLAAVQQGSGSSAQPAVSSQKTPVPWSSESTYSSAVAAPSSSSSLAAVVQAAPSPSDATPVSSSSSKASTSWSSGSTYSSHPASPSPPSSSFSSSSLAAVGQQASTPIPQPAPSSPATGTTTSPIVSIVPDDDDATTSATSTNLVTSSAAISSNTAVISPIAAGVPPSSSSSSSSPPHISITGIASSSSSPSSSNTPPALPVADDTDNNGPLSSSIIPTDTSISTLTMSSTVTNMISVTSTLAPSDSSPPSSPPSSGSNDELVSSSSIVPPYANTSSSVWVGTGWVAPSGSAGAGNWSGNGTLAFKGESGRVLNALGGGEGMVGFLVVVVGLVGGLVG